MQAPPLPPCAGASFMAAVFTYGLFTIAAQNPITPIYFYFPPHKSKNYTLKCFSNLFNIQLFLYPSLVNSLSCIELDSN
jgi:hypothetical protein